MKIWVVGAGAIGSVVAGKLAPVANVTLVDSWAEHVEVINRDGLRVEYPEGTVVVRAPAVHLSDLHSIADRPDSILLAVKSHATEEVCARLAEVDTDAPVVSVQSAINEETIAAAVGADRTIGAMVRFDGALTAPGQVVSRLVNRRLVVGELDGSVSERIIRLRDVLSAGIPTEISTNIWGQLWTKLIRNCELNPLGAATGWDTQQIAASDEASQVAVRLGIEAARVALALGMVLEEKELFGSPEAYLEDFDSEAMREVTARFRASFVTATRASMQQDIEKGRPTEIDFINGHVVRKARELGRTAPLNARMVDVIKQIESSGARPEPGEVLAALQAVVR